MARQKHGEGKLVTSWQPESRERETGDWNKIYPSKTFS
jgi:hypothetical protein